MPVFAIVAPQGCSILSCVSVIGQAVCIAGAIASGNIAALLGCASKKKVSLTHVFPSLESAPWLTIDIYIYSSAIVLIASMLLEDSCVRMVFVKGSLASFQS